MVSIKRLFIALLTLGLGLALALAGTATAAKPQQYSLANGSGGQLQIGGGLPLPIQATCNATCTGQVFPPLLIPRVLSASVTGTTTRTTGQKLIVPKGVLSKPANWKVLGQADNNPALYAVATNIRYTWPNVTATFSTAARTGTTSPLVDVGGGRSIKYSNALGRKFGGPANFALYLGPPGPAPGNPVPTPGDIKNSAAVTLYVIAVQPTGQPPCAFNPNFGGTRPQDEACVAALAFLQPTGAQASPPQTFGLAAAGGGQPATPFTVTTPGGTNTVNASMGPVPGVGIVKAGASPRGTISLFAFTPNGNTGITNAAASSGFPWTTGMLTIKAAFAGGVGETWRVTGADNRTSKGAGVIKMVSGALSTRLTTKDNANRGWVKLVLRHAPEGTEVPALSPAALAATAGLMLLVAGYTMRRKLFS